MILRDRDANTAWESQADQTPESRVYYCQNWRADVVALMTSAGALINQVRYDSLISAAARRGGVRFSIAKTDLDGDGDVDNADASLFASYHGAGTMPFADWNWDGTKDLSDQSAYTADKNADSGLGRGVPAYSTWSHAGAANRKLYAAYEIDPVLTGSEGWQSVYHVRNRVCLSQLGRWTRRDPLGYVDGMNIYLYSAHPLIVSDFTGLHEGGWGDVGNQCGVPTPCRIDDDGDEDCIDDLEGSWAFGPYAFKGTLTQANMNGTFTWTAKPTSLTLAGTASMNAAQWVFGWWWWDFSFTLNVRTVLNAKCKKNEAEPWICDAVPSGPTPEADEDSAGVRYRGIGFSTTYRGGIAVHIIYQMSDHCFTAQLYGRAVLTRNTSFKFTFGIGGPINIGFEYDYNGEDIHDTKSTHLATYRYCCKGIF